MNASSSDDPVITRLAHFDGIFAHDNPQERIRHARRAATAFRREMLAREPAHYYRSAELIRVPYPTKFGLRGAADVVSPFIHICNRLFIVQFDSAEGLKTLLVSPSDADANAETPFFKRLSQNFGPLEKWGTRLIAPKKNTVAGLLEQTGIEPSDVDYITYDHLHTQDIRRWIGTHDQPGLFPNARLLVMRQEWISAQNLLPPQRDWYCPGGVDGVPDDRVVLLDGAVALGDSVYLVPTPGHTEGNHSIVVRTPEGLMVTSENGVGPDAYAPEHSEIPGVRDWARTTGMEVVLNANTLERSLDQYVSMVLEKEIAGPSERDPKFPNMVCSSEFDAYWAFPGVKPTFRFGDLEFGRPHHASSRAPSTDKAAE
jgi:glyoxylase-like metal-dependent hydrolase (beta-lactamase superfamily II)